MKLLFFDMEFANGQVPGSIYSFGYTVTDEDFNILTPPTDICINPECEWNEYVEKNILAYPKEEVEACPPFPAFYETLKALFASADMAIGFAVNNDVSALRRDCMRYDLEPLAYRHFDVEKLCRYQKEHKEAHGLAGYYAAWCGGDPDHRHRSDGDALATMELFAALCRHLHVTPDMMVEAYPECVGDSAQPSKPKKPSQPAKKSAKKPYWRRKKKSAGAAND